MIQFQWSDAWLLTAIYGASLKGAATLANVIGTGDFINHAIFTLAELNGGLSRLDRAGLVSIKDYEYRLTAQGKQITEHDPKVTKGVFEHMEMVRKRLNAPGWSPRTDPRACGDPEATKVYVTQEAFDRAFEEYRQMLKQPPKKG